MAKKTKNYLDFVPVHNPEFEWTADRDGLVTVHMVHKGVYAAIAQKFFHTPRISHIHLDRYGSYLWQQINGQKDVGQLADDMREHFGEAAEPLYDRLIQYMQTLRNHRFVSFQEKDRGSDM